MRSRRRKRQKKRRRMSWQSWYNRNDVRKQVNKVWFWGWPRSWRSTAPSPSPSPPHATFISEGWGGEGGGAEVSLVVCPNLKVCQRFMPLHLMWMKRKIKKDKRSHKCPCFRVERLFSANILHAPALIQFKMELVRKERRNLCSRIKKYFGRYTCERWFLDLVF